MDLFSVQGCLGCLYIEKSPVTLRDGRVVCSSCEDYRAECEARHVANMASDAIRKAYLVGISEKRGHEAAHSLRKMTWEIINEPARN